MNKPHYYIILFAIIFMERILFTSGLKESRGEVKYKWLTYSVIFTYTMGGVWGFLEYVFFQQHIRNYTISMLGLLILLLGVLLRRTSIKTLGSNWSIHTKIICNQKLIKEGPYKILRHPYYFAVMLELLGISLFFNSVFALLFIFLIHLPILLYRVNLEEHLLLNQFGNEYLQYRPFFARKLLRGGLK